MTNRHVSLLFFSVAAALAMARPATAAEPPNIVYILADDLGYAELGCYGQKKIRTPNIDRLAAEGMRFTQHYSGNAVCAPSRCSLMTGKHPGHAYIRSNLPPTGLDDLRQKYGWETPGQQPIPAAEVTIAELLKRKGYATAAVGKWGLGHVGTTGDPSTQGFDLFFGYYCQSYAHSYYPGNLWRNGEKVKLNNNPPVPGRAQLPAGADPRDPAAYAAFKGTDYAPDRMIDAALRFIRENRDGRFFLYFPTTLPHLALHIPDEELAPYLGKWDETPVTGAHGYTPHPTPRAAYAAMISRFDKDVGRIVALLEELGLSGKTLVMLASDNGTSYTRELVDPAFFNSVGPLRGLKASLYEGGIRVPMIARWPGTIRPSSQTDHISAFWDVLPTLAELTGAEPPGGLDGLSFLPTLLGRPEKQQQHEYLYWEFPAFGGQQAVRMGAWKGVRQNILRADRPKPLQIELYNLDSDVGESKDLAAGHPELVARMQRVMQQEHVPSKLFAMPPIDRP